MKKLIAILGVLVMVIGITACGSSVGGTTNEDSTNGSAVDEMTLSEIMTGVLENVELPKVGEIELNEENFSAYTFIDYKEGYEGLASEAMMSSIAHSVVLVRGENNDVTAEMVASIETNADPRKWICVEAEKVVVKQVGKTAILVMSNEATTDQIIANFEELS